MLKNITRFIVLILIIVAVGYGIYYLVTRSTSDKMVEINPAITSFTLEKPNFVVRGNGLSKVEIWGIPSGTSVTESSYTMIGIAELSTTLDQKSQVWLIPIPKEALLLTEIFAKGFDKNGRLVGKISLPITGASDIYRELWLEASGQSLFLKVGESGVSDGITVKVNKVISDSRCAVDVTCIQAGNVEIELELSNGGKVTKVNLKSDEEGVPFAGHFVKIIDVLPEARSTVKLEESSYTFTISVLKDTKQ